MFIDWLVRFLLPRQDRFFTLLEEIAAKMMASAAVFAELETASGHAQFAFIAARLKPIETEADHVCHQVYAELDRTFATPHRPRRPGGPDLGAGQRHRHHGALRRLCRSVSFRDPHRPD